MKRISLLCCCALFSVVLVGCGGGHEGGVIEQTEAQPPSDIELEMETEEYAEAMNQLGQEE